MPRLTHHETRPDETGKVDHISLVIDTDRSEVSIDIRLKQPAAGDKPLHKAIRRELADLWKAIDGILETPGAI